MGNTLKGFIQVPYGILIRTDLPDAAKLLYGHLLNRYRMCQAYGKALSDSQASMGKTIGKSTKTITRLISLLKSAGLIKTEVLKYREAAGNIVTRTEYIIL